MCGGIAFDIGSISEEELRRFFSPEEYAAFTAMGRAESFFWARRPVLPVVVPELGEGAHLYDWGNREKGVDLPRTGWARMESLESGRWNYLRPVEIMIPARRGCEKKVWFDIAGSLVGVLVEREGAQRAYMVTVPSTEEYRARTGHDRMPMLRNGSMRFD